MSLDVQEIYAQVVRQLPLQKRLRLAALILDEITKSVDELDISSEWDEQDQNDLSKFALLYAMNQDDDSDKKL